MKFCRDDRPVLLDAGWWLTLSPEPLDVGDGSKEHFEARGSDVMPASVPGSVELDLLANGRIPEPFEGRNILDLRWVEQTYAYYGTSFVVPGPPDADRMPVIDFEGLDCDATVYLNGTVIHRSQNMLIEHRAPVGDALIYDAPNVLCVELSPVLERARSGDYAYPAGLIAEGSGYEGLYVRKAPHMFGWDIMPRAVSAGIWRPITLRFLPVERLDWVWIDTISRATDSTARLLVRYRATSSGPLEDLEIVVAGTCGSSHFDARAALLFDAGSIEIDIEDALLWWPKGRGEPNLYDIRVTLLRRGEAVDSLSLRHGIRTVVLDRTSVTTEDGDGEFRFIVNGDPIFVLGTNWVPLDAYHARDFEPPRERPRPAGRDRLQHGPVLGRQRLRVGCVLRLV